MLLMSPIIGHTYTYYSYLRIITYRVEQLYCSTGEDELEPPPRMINFHFDCVHVFISLERLVNRVDNW